MDWKFEDPKNVAVITSRGIMQAGDWIAFVSHDEDDGGWQFHGEHPTQEADAAVVALQSIVALDSSVQELADLPLGWHAWRETKDGAWQRSQTA